MPTLDNDWDVLRLAKCRLRDLLTFMELPWMLSYERAQAERRMAKVCRLEERICEAEENLEAVCVAPAPVDQLTAKRPLFTAVTKQSKEERDN